MNLLSFADTLCEARVAQVLRNLGRLPRAGRPEAVHERAAPLFEALVRFAIHRGLLRPNRRPTARLLTPSPVAEWIVAHPEVWAADPVAFAWLARALDGLEDVLRGNRLAEDVLFPGGTFDLVGRLYAESPLMGGFAAVASEQLTNSTEVLELGAGTGSTHLLRHSSLDTYHFTDIAAGLIDTRKACGTDPREQAWVFDMDGSWADVPPVDAIVAVNVLHVSRDPARLLRTAYAHLPEHGRLVIGEISSPEPGPFPLIELSFGLLPSFWRPDGRSPLLPLSDWRDLLEEAGFSRIETLPWNPPGTEVALGGVLVAVKESP